MIRTPQLATPMVVFCLTTVPFWPVIVVGITSLLAHRLPLAVSALCEPTGRFTVMLETGTSGVDANVVVVMPFLMSVLPTRIVRTPLASITRSRSGNAAAACETRIAGPVSLPGSVGVFARAPPTNDPGGQWNGFDSNVAAGHAFCSVVRRDGSSLGSCTLTDLTFAWPGISLSVVSRLAPLAFDVFALLFALNEGLNFRALHAVSCSGLDRFCVAPNVDVIVDSVASGEQLVGFNRNPCLLIDTVTPRNLVGMPLTIVGSVAVVVTRAVNGSTLIVARVVTGPRLNGPATAGTT